MPPKGSRDKREADALRYIKSKLPKQPTVSGQQNWLMGRLADLTDDPELRQYLNKRRRKRFSLDTVIALWEIYMAELELAYRTSQDQPLPVVNANDYLRLGLRGADVGRKLAQIDIARGLYDFPSAINVLVDGCGPAPGLPAPEDEENVIDAEVVAAFGDKLEIG